MRARAISLGMLIIVTVLPVIGIPAEAIDLENEDSSVVVRTYLQIDNDGVINLKFKVLWGRTEFEESNIFIPSSDPPDLQWDDMKWENLKQNINQSDTIRYLFNSTISNSKKITDSVSFFAKTILEIDCPYSVRWVEPRILSEFQTIEIEMDIVPSDSTYTIKPLQFLKNIDFKGYPPVGEVIIETESCINLQPSSLAANHFLYPEGHRFKSEPLYYDYGTINYDTEKDSIKVRKLQPAFSSSILYSLWGGAALLSMIFIGIVARKAKKRVHKGFEMWVGIGAVCFFAIIPYHIFVSYALLIFGFLYSMRKRRNLMLEYDKTKSEKEDQLEDKDEEKNLESESEKGTGKEVSNGKNRESSESENGKKVRQPLPLSQTTMDKGSMNFTVPGMEKPKSNLQHDQLQNNIPTTKQQKNQLISQLSQKPLTDKLLHTENQSKSSPSTNLELERTLSKNQPISQTSNDSEFQKPFSQNQPIAKSLKNNSIDNHPITNQSNSNMKDNETGSEQVKNKVTPLTEKDIIQKQEKEK